MTELSREQIERIREAAIYQRHSISLTSSCVIDICNMALRTHDAEADRDNYRAKFLQEREATDEWATRAQRAEAECERLREQVQTLAADFEMVASREPDDHARNVRKNAAVQLRSMLSATPPPEGEPEQYEHLGDLSAVEPWHRVPMACERCKVSWEGCWDNYQCPRCGEGELPWSPDPTDDTPEQAHGDALAALMQIVRAHVASQDDAIAADQCEEEIRRHLTASGVPHVPEEVRRLPEDWMQQAGQARRCLNDGKSAVYESCSRQLDKALASAPAVPVSKYGEHSADVVADSNWSAGARFGWNCAIAGDKERLERAIQSRIDERAQIAAAPTDGRE